MGLRLNGPLVGTLIKATGGVSAFLDAWAVAILDDDEGLDRATGRAGTDTLAEFENIVGGLGADTLTGNSDANKLIGRAERDFWAARPLGLAFAYSTTYPRRAEVIARLFLRTNPTP